MNFWEGERDVETGDCNVILYWNNLKQFIFLPLSEINYPYLLLLALEPVDRGAHIDAFLAKTISILYR
jgi:hypothetical protein